MGAQVMTTKWRINLVAKELVVNGAVIVDVICAEKIFNNLVKYNPFNKQTDSVLLFGNLVCGHSWAPPSGFETRGDIIEHYSNKMFTEAKSFVPAVENLARCATVLTQPQAKYDWP